MLSRREFLRTGAIVTTAGLLGCSKQFISANRNVSRPNVIILLTDDQGHGDLACHGNRIIRTPNLDKLFSESVRLTDFHVSPLCTPTRASIMTGCDAARTGAWGTTWGRSIPRREFPMMSEVFANSGYQTGMFGKWHLGDNYPYRPEDRGFMEVVRHGGGGVGQTPDYWGNDYFDDTYFHNGGEPEKYAGYCTDVWFDNTIKFIEKNKNRPFFCYLATNAPHAPYIVGQEYKDMYKGNNGVPDEEFYGMITNIDDNVGRLRAKLKELGIEDNTIFIYMTDNGTAAGIKGDKGFNSGMRGMKGSLYEGGHRVPCFIRWPQGNLVGGRDIDELTAHIDLMPTLTEICGLKTPANAKWDGMSFAGVLQNRQKAMPERSIVLQFSQTTTPPPKWDGVVLDGKWRYLPGSNELYNIASDPGQTNNVVEQHPEIAKKLRGRYEQWWEKVEKTFDKASRIVIGSDKENPVTLSGLDWCTNSTAWDQSHVREAAKLNGPWMVEVERDGEYEFRLQRWPKEIDVPINKPDGTGTKAIAAEKARIKIQGIDLTEPIEPDAASARFRVKLRKGNADLQTWFIDGQGQEICGAYYVYVSRI